MLMMHSLINPLAAALVSMFFVRSLTEDTYEEPREHWDADADERQ
jgi:hypothetical protein